MLLQSWLVGIQAVEQTCEAGRPEGSRRLESNQCQALGCGITRVLLLRMAQVETAASNRSHDP